MKWSVRNADISSLSKRHSNEIRKTLINLKNNKLLIVGLGNAFRGDDSAGLYLIDQLLVKKLPRKWILLKCYENPENYLNVLTADGLESIIFIDTVNGIKEKIRIFRASEIQDFSFTTHSFGLSSIIYYIKNFQNPSIYLIGMKPYDLSLKTEISDEMKNTANILLKGFENL